MKAYYLNDFQNVSEGVYRAAININLIEDFYFQTAARYRGVPVIPGSFQVELAVEFASKIFSLSQPSEIELSDIRFLRVPKFSKPHLELIIQASMSRPSQVEIKLCSEFRAKTGQKLSDIVYSTMQASIAKSVKTPQMKEFNEIDAYLDPDIPSAFYSEASPLHLGKFFNCVSETLIYKNLRRSVYFIPYELNHPAFRSHLVAPLLIDAIMQNGLKRRNHTIEVCIPESIGRLRFAPQLGHDTSVQSMGRLYLRSEVGSAPGEILIAQARTGLGNTLLTIENLNMTLLGYFDVERNEVIESYEIQSEV